MELIWKEIESNSRTYITQFEDEVVHIINTGFNDTYMVVWEDAYEIMLGKVKILSKAGVEKLFSIKL